MSQNVRKRGLGASKERQRRKLGEGFLQGRLLRLECLEERRLLSLAPVLSEVEAGNKNGIVDALGNSADWLEIYNPDPTTAVNLGGWTINYAKTNSSTTHSWTFPNNVILGPGAFRVIFCDSADTNTSAEDPLGELDTGFSLSKDGATLELINTSAATVSSLTYTTLSSDTSYGPLDTVAETDLVAAGATASYYAPTAPVANWNMPSFNASSWASGPTGLGYTGSSRLRNHPLQGRRRRQQRVQRGNGYQHARRPDFGSQRDRELVGFHGHRLGRPLHQYQRRETLSWSVHRRGLEQHRLAGRGNAHDHARPGGVLHVRRQQRRWVHVDDRYRLEWHGCRLYHAYECDQRRGYQHADLRQLAWSGRHPGHHVPGRGELSGQPGVLSGRGRRQHGVLRRQGEQLHGATSFDANSILVGDTTATTAAGGISTTTTPLAITMRSLHGKQCFVRGRCHPDELQSAVNAALAAAGSTSLYSRITFNAANLASLTSLTLRMQYDSGYVAYLNGVEIASSNAPTSPAWNSTAVENLESPVQVTTYQDVDVSSF